MSSCGWLAVSGLRVQVRLARPEDGADLRDIYGPIVRETATSFELDPPSAEEMSARVARITTTHPWIVAEVDGKVVGYAYGSRHRERHAYQWSVEVSVYMSPEYQKQGVARILYEALFDLLVIQGFYNAYAGVSLPNPPSEAFHARMGFEPVGVYRKIGYKFGKWHDTGWSQRALQPPSKTPTDPKPIADVVDDVRWKRTLAEASRRLAERVLEK